MPRNRLPYVNRETTRHGRVVWYFRRGEGQPRIRLPDQYGSDEFLAAYHAALAGKAPEPPARTQTGTLAWLVEKYKSSAHWRGLDAVTQRRRDTVFREMVERAGAVGIRQITPKAIRQAVNERAERGTWAANNFLKAVRPLFGYATSLELIDADPCTGIKMLAERTDGFKPWSEEHLAKYERRHPIGTRARLALDLMLYTGMRRGDVVRVGPANIRDGLLTYVPLKTAKTSRVEVTIRILPPLAASIAATVTGMQTLLVHQHGGRFASSNSFGEWFKRRCREAGVPDVSSHGLRKAAATRAAEAGATTHELMSMFGWTKPAQAEVYTRAADRRRIGVAASDKLARK